MQLKHTNRTSVLCPKRDHGVEQSHQVADASKRFVLGGLRHERSGIITCCKRYMQVNGGRQGHSDSNSWGQHIEIGGEKKEREKQKEGRAVTSGFKGGVEGRGRH